MNAPCLGRKAMLSLTVILGLGLGIDATVYAQDDEALEEVTITGSRIVRRDFTSQSPIVTIDTETFENRVNIGIEAALNQLPQFTVAGTQSQLSAAGTPFPQASAAPGAATINLRGLGINRSLVLVDGRRVQPVNGLLVVDLNTIPSAAIGSIEVITGGAAAVYGADAIAGVVNLKLKRDFEGMEFSTNYGTSEEGDGEELQLSGLIGADFADGRGNVMIGANYSDRNIIFGKDRPWVSAGWADPGTQGGGIGSSNLSQFTPAGTNAPTAGFPLLGATYGIDQNGAIFDPSNPLNPARPYTGPLGGNSGFKINPDGTLGYDEIERNYLQLPLERYSIFGSAHFDLAENIQVFTDIRFSETYASASGFTSGVFNVWSPTVPYNPANDDPDSPTFGQATVDHPVSRALADLLNSRPTPNAPWTYVGGLDYLGNFTTQTTSNVYQVIGGLRGDIPFGNSLMNDWSWEVYASHGKSTVLAQQPEGFPYLPRLQNLFNANQYGEGYAVTFPIAITGSCTTGLPIFNPDGSVDNTPSVSKNCSDYVVLRMNSITTLSQDVIEGNVQGGLYDLPAGRLQFALGGVYREENFGFDPDSGYNANQDYPNVVQNIILPVTVDGSTDVKEIYAELAIPVVKDLPFVKSFEVDPGVRYSEYNTAGGVETYKVLGDWAVNDWVRFRGGYQVANRAANVTELFTPKGGSALTTGTDACANYTQTAVWGNVPGNSNRLNVQTLCQYLMVREGAPSTLYVPGTASANDYRYNVFGGQFYFPFVIGVTEGNPALESESADTFTAGVVFNSPFDHPALERMTLSVDWYQIDITNAIGTPNHDVIYQQCLDAQYNSLVGGAPGSSTGAQMAANNPFCALIQREYVGGVPLSPGNLGADRKYSAQFINQGGINSVGIDIQLDWGLDLADAGIDMIPGSFNMNILASVLDTYEESPFPGGDFIEYTGSTFNSSFNYRLFSTFGYNNGPLSVGLRWQHLPSIDTPPGTPATTFGVESHDQIDLFGRWSFFERYELRAGIDNLLNADPEIVGASTTDNNLGSTSANYDTIGRRYFVGITAKF